MIILPQRFLVFCVIFLSSQPLYADLVQKSAPEVADTTDLTVSLLKVVGGLLLVVLAILGSAWLYRRYGNLAPISNDALKVIGGVSMGQKERVVLMQVGEEQILLGVSPGRIQRLHVLQNNIEITAQDNSKDKAFSTQLNAMLKRNATETEATK